MTVTKFKKNGSRDLDHAH